jgi:sugar-phosphatase
VVVEDAAAGVLAGLNAGSHVIAVNVPADSPRLSEADFVLNTLTAINVTKGPGGVVTVSLKM